jgi:hypothetical protein
MTTTQNVRAYHFLGFVMHQPEGNLLHLLDDDRESYQVKQILLAYERPVKYAEDYADVAQFCVCFSGILLEQLQDQRLIDRVRDYIDLPRMLARYAAAKNIELAGTGYYHPLFPLIPQTHWTEQITRGRDKIIEVFGREPHVFFPPEMGFSCSMVPHLVDAGYRYVTVDGVHLRPTVPVPDEETIYSAYLCEQSGSQIILIPRDAELSTPQERGTVPDEVRELILKITDKFDRPALVTTWTDGENGNWFRNEHEPSNFWGRFFTPYMERVRNRTAILIPTSLDDFIAAYPVDRSAMAIPGTWKYRRTFTEVTSFEHWVHSRDGRDVMDELVRIDASFRTKLGAVALSDADTRLRQALGLILQAEASDNFWYDNPGWLQRSRKKLDEARRLLEQLN